MCPQRLFRHVRQQRVSLRARLLRTVLFRLVLALTLADAATSWAVHDLLLRDLDSQLSATAVLADQYVIAQHVANQAPDLTGTTSKQWSQASGQGLLPALLLMRLADGSQQTIGGGPSISPSMTPGLKGTGSDQDGAKFYTASLPSGDGSTRTYRIRVSYLPDDEGTLVLASSEQAVSDTMVHIGEIEVVTWLLALTTVGLMTSRKIRRQLRPFERMGETIVEIGSGDLDQRVSPADPRTELGRVGYSVNLMLTRLEHAFKEQRSSENRLRRFVADASHELRTPLASIRGYAELFRRGAASRPEDLALAMRRIESEAERMGVLVDELLLLARLDSGRPLERTVVDLTALIADAARDSTAADPRWPVEAANDASAPVHVIGDVDRLRQVLANLLANVRAHTPPGTPATISARRTEGGAVIEVADSGPGLTSDQQGMVFERFYRGDASRGRGRDGEGGGSTGGSGLGLSIVASVAEAHGGRARVVSAPGAGCVFTVALPVPGPRSADLTNAQTSGEARATIAQTQINE
ncbi:sensor histidine kinase [Actinospica robiniae]|uniref:sensor histidine kinase n=1 Tax=Actinospica robiniae TaxID=304901 RepID=UPI000415B8FD|nr:HAMP domain-containing sensor histidine kinase [Actinospica robiniae]